jgi:hypothetical protein
MVGFVLDEADGRLIDIIFPLDSALTDIVSDGLDRAYELPLFDGERAHGKIHRGTLRQQYQDIQKSDRILAAGNGYRDAITAANHLESMNGFAGLAEQRLFEVHKTIVAESVSS